VPISTAGAIAAPVEPGELLRKYALQNAVFYGGKAQPGAVLGKALAEHPELRPQAKELGNLAAVIVSEVNRLAVEAQRAELERLAPELLVREPKVREAVLPELGDVRGPVVMRFAPGPSGPLHIGHTRVAILNDEYVRRYGGEYLNRMEDTNPEKIEPSAYDMIPEELSWLGCKITKTLYQSDRFPIYYEHARRLLELGGGYVCTCNPEEWRKLKEASQPCPHREAPLEDQLERWTRMFDGTYGPEEASFVVKTDLQHPNPAIRDFVGLRIDEVPHPRTGSKYRVYPLMNFAVALDDHLLGLTHVIRGKDHLNNTHRQAYVFDYFGWPKPVYFHYGRVSIEEVELSTSGMKEGIRSGKFTGWDDLRLGTVRAMMRRGIQPEALRHYWIEVGLKEVDIQFSWKTLYAHNRELIDAEANRYFFVWDPTPLRIEGAEELLGHAPLHPDHPERGRRSVRLTAPITVRVCSADLTGHRQLLRLKDLGNVLVEGDRGFYQGDSLEVLRQGAGILHWVGPDAVAATVRLPDGSTLEGLVEGAILGEQGPMVQFERFGYARIERLRPTVEAAFAHP